MSLKSYVCNRWPHYQIGPHIRFANGQFETDDPLLQSIIERNNAWGIQIHYRDSEEETARQVRLKQEAEAAEKGRAVQEALDAQAKQEKEQKKEEKAQSLQAGADAKTAKERERVEQTAKQLAQDEKQADAFGVRQTKAKGK